MTMTDTPPTLHPLLTEFHASLGPQLTRGTDLLPGWESTLAFLHQDDALLATVEVVRGANGPVLEVGVEAVSGPVTVTRGRRYTTAAVEELLPLVRRDMHAGQWPNQLPTVNQLRQGDDDDDQPTR